MGVRLQRHLGRVEQLLPGQYTVETASGRPAICCVGCGTISDLPETHRVTGGGIVVPVWSCPSRACPFMDFLSFEAWGEDVVPA